MATTHDSGDGPPPETPSQQSDGDNAPREPGSGLTCRWRAAG